MEIYLIRHTTPDVAKGVCYGQTDLDVTESFLHEATIIRKYLPGNIQQVYSSPLQRCSKLAQHLFPLHAIQFHRDLMEINCGLWEMKRWDDIPKATIDPWMEDFVNVRIPEGENYIDLHERVNKSFNDIAKKPFPAVIVAHGGVIRSILAGITNTPLIDSYAAFSLHYGCVITIEKIDGQMQHKILSNIPHEKETHKPSYL